jgi:hypothetical protein
MAMTKQEQAKKNVKLGLILASVALAFAIGFIFKIAVFGK